MARRKRDDTTASQLRKGDLFEPNGLGIKARVTRIDQHPNVAEPHVAVSYAYPNDFSVNANHRGVHSGHIYRPGDRVTRWIEPSPTRPRRTRAEVRSAPRRRRIDEAQERHRRIESERAAAEEHQHAAEQATAETAAQQRRTTFTVVIGEPSS